MGSPFSFSDCVDASIIISDEEAIASRLRNVNLKSTSHFLPFPAIRNIGLKITQSVLSNKESAYEENNQTWEMTLWSGREK